VSEPWLPPESGDAHPALAVDPSGAWPREWYGGSPVEAARRLLGCLLVSLRDDGITAGFIVETEAYGGPDDPASHAAFRRTGAVTAMWGPSGTAYVYVAYGVYPCFNVVTGERGEPSAVLVRAIEPYLGIDLMARRRGGGNGTRLASGPGRLAIALGISLHDNGRTLDRAPLWIQPGRRVAGIAVGTRVGVRRGIERPWRFAVERHGGVSRRFPPSQDSNEGRRS